MDFDLNEEQRMWQKAVHDFVAAEVRPFAREADETGEFNWAAVRKMGPLGLLGLNIPEEYGGTGHRCGQRGHRYRRAGLGLREYGPGHRRAQRSRKHSHRPVRERRAKREVAAAGLQRPEINWEVWR